MTRIYNPTRRPTAELAGQHTWHAKSGRTFWPLWLTIAAIIWGAVLLRLLLAVLP